ncbi:hypothetical protein [Microbacterium sp. SORGH_AS_0454]|uniref:hypothetical protein n=1 Tax=Microbacterium sp. SORGH_AS_0454 TaxID=3041758 RepID=UPI0028624EE8|nr:hypothetical protein [Microbacterium sp. SORGH_AS_0454]MDR6098338.1 hypothetical protein [Microbacterium sp. SORGH_AS_0454]
MALFKPDPDRSIEDIVEDLGREIADRFRDAEDEAIAEVAARARRDMDLSPPDCPKRPPTRVSPSRNGGNRTASSPTSPHTVHGP